MSDSDDEVQTICERREVVEPDWIQLKTSINPLLFKSYKGFPISFHFKMDDLTLKSKYEDIIVSYGGCKVEEYIDMDNHTVLIIEDSSRTLIHERPAFKASYVTDCIKDDSLLNIRMYLHNYGIFKPRDFMKIIFWRQETFTYNIVEQCVDSSEEESPTAGRSGNSIKDLKHSRDMYSRKEKECILKFILVHKKLDGLRGNSIWKKMERRGVCPKRTYQSLKNHFLKYLVNELDRFEFLSEYDKKKMRKLET